MKIRIAVTLVVLGLLINKVDHYNLPWSSQLHYTYTIAYMPLSKQCNPSLYFGYRSAWSGLPVRTVIQIILSQSAADIIYLIKVSIVKRRLYVQSVQALIFWHAMQRKDLKLCYTKVVIKFFHFIDSTDIAVGTSKCATVKFQESPDFNSMHATYFCHIISSTNVMPRKIIGGLMT